MRPTPAAASPLVVALAWTVALLIRPTPFADHAVLLIGVGFLLLATTSLVGMVLVGGRWAHRLALTAVAMGAAIALVRPIDVWWIAALVLTAVAGVLLFTRRVTGMIRKRPPAASPPQEVTLLTVVLILTPALIGLANARPPWAALVVGLGAPVAAFLYTRVLPSGLIAVRMVWPLLALALSPVMELGEGLLMAGLGVGVAYLAWRPEVKVAYHPPRESVSK